MTIRVAIVDTTTWNNLPQEKKDYYDYNFVNYNSALGMLPATFTEDIYWFQLSDVSDSSTIIFTGFDTSTFDFKVIGNYKKLLYTGTTTAIGVVACSGNLTFEISLTLTNSGFTDTIAFYAFAGGDNVVIQNCIIDCGSFGSVRNLVLDNAAADYTIRNAVFVNSTSIGLDLITGNNYTIDRITEYNTVSGVNFNSETLNCTRSIFSTAINPANVTFSDCFSENSSALTGVNLYVPSVEFKSLVVTDREYLEPVRLSILIGSWGYAGGIAPKERTPAKIYKKKGLLILGNAFERLAEVDLTGGDWEDAEFQVEQLRITNPGNIVVDTKYDTQKTYTADAFDILDLKVTKIYQTGTTAGGITVYGYNR